MRKGNLKQKIGSTAKENLKAMQQKVNREIIAIMGSDDELGPFPQQLQTLTQPIRDEMAGLDLSDPSLLSSHIEKLSDVQLEVVARVLEKKSGVQQSERVMALASGMVRELKLVDSAIAHLEKLKLDLVLQFSTILTNEFNTEKSDGSIVISCEQLSSKVSDVMKYRKMLRKIVKDVPGACLEEVLPAASSSFSSGCAIS